MSISTTTRQASVDEIAAEMDRRGRAIEQLEARLAHIDGIYRGAIDNLQHHQRQLDQDGIEVAVSRQALWEVLAGVEAALALPASQPAHGAVEALREARYNVSMSESDGRTWLHLTRDDGVSASLSCTSHTGNGDETIVSQVVKEFATLAQPAPQDGWRDMSTLADDDTLVLAGCAPDNEFPQGRVMIWKASFLLDNIRRGNTTPQHLRYPAIGWKPIPAAPTKGAE